MHQDLKLSFNEVRAWNWAHSCLHLRPILELKCVTWLLFHKKEKRCLSNTRDSLNKETSYEVPQSGIRGSEKGGTNFRQCHLFFFLQTSSSLPTYGFLAFLVPKTVSPSGTLSFPLPRPFLSGAHLGVLHPKLVLNHDLCPSPAGIRTLGPSEHDSSPIRSLKDQLSKLWKKSPSLWRLPPVNYSPLKVK